MTTAAMPALKTVKPGAHYNNGACEFIVWAPLINDVSLRILSPSERIIGMEKLPGGFRRSVVTGLGPGTRYRYRLNNEIERADPASFYQGDGVHGASFIVDHNSFIWGDEAWQGIPPKDMIIYELHVGTFTPEGTFEAIIERLDDLKELGINAIEIMPVSQFPGERNWGYDGVFLYAVQNSYGGPEGMKRLVNACHKKGIAFILDVVYNHFGPEGNCLADFGPYFTDRCKTPWGRPVNLDAPYSDGVRSFIVNNALYWFYHYHADALRLDAVHGIYDFGARHILEELSDETRLFSQGRRRVYLIAESDLNDVRIIKQKEAGGYGIDAQWSDDFHHALHALITGENKGYYADFGRIEQLAKAFKEGFIYSWEYSPCRKRYHGSSSKDLAGGQFIVCTQNHDQIGNRMLGERLSHLASPDALKLAAGALFVSPYVPMLFMGEEYAEEAPFLYFISHSDKALIEATRLGRRRDFRAFDWDREPPDPQDADTFMRCRLNWKLRLAGKHRAIYEYYKKLIQLRRQIPSMSHLDRDKLRAWCDAEKKILFIKRDYGDDSTFCCMHFNGREVDFKPASIEGRWEKLIDSHDKAWMGNGSSLPEDIERTRTYLLKPWHFALYRRTE